jgi:type I restriction enzyme S subunit
MVYPDDFILTNSMSFGFPYIMKTSGCIHDGWLLLRPRIKNIDQDYLYQVLSSPSVYLEFSKKAAGATVKNLNIDLVSGVEIAVPTLQQQQDFSHRMHFIEELVSKNKKLLQIEDSLFNSLQHRAFAGEL